MEKYSGTHRDRRRPARPGRGPGRNDRGARGQLAGKPHVPPRGQVRRVAAGQRPGVAFRGAAGGPPDSRRSGLSVVSAPGGEEAGGFREVRLELVGTDHPGIVRDISTALAHRKVNVEELSTETVDAPMSGQPLFRAVARLHLPAEASVDELRGDLEAVADDLMVDVSLVLERGSRYASVGQVGADQSLELGRPPGPLRRARSPPDRVRRVPPRSSAPPVREVPAAHRGCRDAWRSSRSSGSRRRARGRADRTACAWSSGPGRRDSRVPGGFRGSVRGSDPRA